MLKRIMLAAAVVASLAGAGYAASVLTAVPAAACFNCS